VSVAGAALLALCTTALSAQSATYRERSDGVVTLETPGGPLQLRSEHRATITVEGVGSDSLHAWYTELAVTAIDPSGAADRPDPADVIGKLFVLRVGPSGRIETLSTPEFPESFASVTDLTLQFFDFFPSQPQGGYVDGAAWTDTTFAPQGSDPATTSTGTKVTEYRIVGRTERAGVAAFEIEAAVELVFTTEGPVPDQPMLTARTRTQGQEMNTFLVTVSGGELLHRARDGELSGQIEYIGAPQPIVLPLMRTYTSVIERLSGGG
jgi:hypothetical protein